MNQPTDRFAAWASAELGLGGARIERELSGGNSNLTRLVVHDDGQLVMRSAPANTISPKAHLGVQREAKFMAALEGHAPVPKVLCWCDDETVNGQPFALVEHIDGVSITDALPASYDNVDSLNSDASMCHAGCLFARREDCIKQPSIEHVFQSPLILRPPRQTKQSLQASLLPVHRQLSYLKL